jgi:hypothetical protein
MERNQHGAHHTLICIKIHSLTTNTADSIVNMVRSFIPALALLALSATVGAAPALETNLDVRATDDPQVNGGDFTVERWVEACAKNPDDTTTCVSPLTAAVALMNARAAKGDSSGSLSKRAPICTNAFPPADVRSRRLPFVVLRILMKRLLGYRCVVLSFLSGSIERYSMRYCGYVADCTGRKRDTH